MTSPRLKALPPANLLETQSFHLAVLDIAMPGEDGLARPLAALENADRRHLCYRRRPRSTASSG
jgi:hypothetical protein